MDNQRPIGRSLEGINRSGAMDQRVVGPRQLVDLDLEAEINADVSRVVVVLLFGMRESYEDAGVVVGRGHHPFKTEHVASRRRPRKPQHAQVGAGMSLEGAAADKKVAGVIVSRLIADRGHLPVAEGQAIEEWLKARIGN